VDPVPGSLLLRKSGSAWNLTHTSGSEARNTSYSCERFATILAVIPIVMLVTSGSECVFQRALARAPSLLALD
jgi:hypothetical protein